MKYGKCEPGWFIMGAVALVLSVAALAFGDMARRALLLRFDGEPAVADVTATDDVRRVRRSGNSRYTIKYRFGVGDPPVWYTHTDILVGTENVCASLPRPAWEEAMRTGKVGVTYARSDPAINAPVDAGPMQGIWCPLIGFLSMAFMAVLSLALVAGDVKRSRPRPAPQDAGAIS
jgi:hypothetical protein